MALSILDNALCALAAEEMLTLASPIDVRSRSFKFSVKTLLDPLLNPTNTLKLLLAPLNNGLPLNSVTVTATIGSTSRPPSTSDSAIRCSASSTVSSPTWIGPGNSGSRIVPSGATRTVRENSGASQIEMPSKSWAASR